MYPARAFFLFGLMLLRGMAALLNSAGSTPRSVWGVQRKSRARTLGLGTFKEILARILRDEARQFMQQLPHAFIHGFRHDHLQLHVLIPTMPRPANRRDAFFPQAQFLATVRARRNAQKRPAVDCRDLNFRAERRFRHGNGDNGVKVFATAVKKGMRQDFSDDVQIARGRARRSGISTAGNAHARSGLHPCRNSNFDGVGTAHAAFATACPADISNAPGAAAARASQIEAHLPAGLRYLPGTAAGGAGLGLAGRSRAMAGGAYIKARDRELLHRAVYGFPKGDLDLILQA